MLHFRFAADVDAIAPIVEKITDFARRALDDGKLTAVSLAVQEALANAVVHGSGRDRHKTVECWIARGQKGILIVVRDSGAGFDPNAIPNPLSEQHLSADHGRGIHMIRQLMDDVHFQRNGAEIHMRKA